MVTRQATQALQMPQSFVSASAQHRIYIRLQRPIIHTFRSRPSHHQPMVVLPSWTCSGERTRTFSSSGRIFKKQNYASQARELNQKGLDEHEKGFENQMDGTSIRGAKELQTRTPWHREGSEKPPVKKMRRAAGSMTKGAFPSLNLPVV